MPIVHPIQHMMAKKWLTTNQQYFDVVEKMKKMQLSTSPQSPPNHSEENTINNFIINPKKSEKNIEVNTIIAFDYDDIIFPNSAITKIITRHNSKSNDISKYNAKVLS